MHITSHAGITLELLSTSLHGAFDENESNPPPNILWLMMDGCRPDALGCYGTPWAHTPHIDQIAARGVCFKNATTQCPVCVPSRNSMKTGHYCHEIGKMYSGEKPDITPPYAATAKDYPNLLNHWTNRGMRPVNLGKSSAFQKDWDQKADLPARVSSRRHDSDKYYAPVSLTTYGWQIGGTQDIHVDDTIEGVLTDQALDVLKSFADQGTPFFLRISYQPPHVPIQVPPPFMLELDAVNLPFPNKQILDSKPRFEREQLRIYSGTLDLSEHALRVARATYYGMVSMVDYFIGKLMDALNMLGLMDNTLIAVNSDHGQALGENGLHKKRSFYDPVIQAPLIISWPGHLPQNKLITEQVEMLDLIPTFMDIAGMHIPETLSGKSLLPLMLDKETTGREVTYAEIDYSGSMYQPLRENSGRRVMARTRDWKLDYFNDPRVPGKDGALYNLTDDPWEHHNMYCDPACRDVIEELEQCIHDWDHV